MLIFLFTLAIHRINSIEFIDKKKERRKNGSKKKHYTQK